MLVARVGGRWYESSQCGWFDFAFLSLSSDAGDQIGARLLNLIRDLMCRLLRLYALRSCRRSSTTCIVVGLDVCVSAIALLVRSCRR